MILKKENLNGEVIYKEIKMEEALKENKEDLLFTNKEENMYDSLKVKEENGNGTFQEKIQKVLDDVQKGAIKGFNKTKSFFQDLQDKAKASSNTDEILKIIPYMSDEDIHEIGNMIVNDENYAKKIKIKSLLPYFTDLECDRLFLHFLENRRNDINLKDMLPFVSDMALGEAVNIIIENNISDINFEILYPYLESSDLKRLINFLYFKEQ